MSLVHQFSYQRPPSVTQIRSLRPPMSQQQCLLVEGGLRGALPNARILCVYRNKTSFTRCIHKTDMSPALGYLPRYENYKASLM